MVDERVRRPWSGLLVGVLTTIVLLLSGCGGGDDQCAGASCDFGHCDAQTGQCVNPDECRVDDDCVPGYECGADYTCQALASCAVDDDCAAGVCAGGGCVNPPSCDANSDCLERTFCGPGGTCIPDPCRNFTCQRGVCERGTEQCVSADSCTSDTEAKDCLAGEKCAQGSCETAETFCDEFACERGECSFDDGGCVNASDCDGNDQLCEQGYFCNDQDRCRPDLCERNLVFCDHGGECIPSTGECRIVEGCQSDDQCVSDHRCVDGICRHESAACGDADGDGGCPGSQTCHVEDGRANCEEPDTCRDAFDCSGERQCAGLDCREPLACTDDFFEPNDTPEQATEFLDVAADNTASASLCSGDTDVFELDSAQIINSAARGTLLVEVDVARRAWGLGQIDVVLTDPDGGEQTANTGALSADGTARLEYSLSPIEHGVFSVELSANDDVKTAGVSYDLSVNLLPSNTIDACDEAAPLRVGQTVDGDMDGVSSTSLGSSCTGSSGDSAELIYEFEIDEPQEVMAHISPELSSADLSMSIRRRCTQAASETACVDATEDGGAETLTALLGEGTYYLVVDAAEGGSGGAFTLELSSVHTVCSSAEDYCEDTTVAQICTNDGGRFESTDCTEGCNPTTGRCFPAVGDTCLDTDRIAPIGAPGSRDSDESSPAFSKEIDLVQMTNRYRLSEESCIAAEDTRTGGPDQALELELPAQTSVSAKVEFSNEVEGSIYLLEQCTDPDGACVAGAAGSGATSSQELLRYSNATDDDQTLYLIIDTGAGEAVDVAQLDVWFDDVVCEPAQNRCRPTDEYVVEMCGEYGVEWQSIAQCVPNFPCESGACTDPDACADALDVTAEAGLSGGVSYTGLWEDFNADFMGFNCHDDWLGSYSEDLVFQVDLQAGDALFVSADTTDPNDSASIAISTDCQDAVNTCVQGVWEDYVQYAELTYNATVDETVFVIIDHLLADPGAQYSLTIEIN